LLDAEHDAGEVAFAEFGSDDADGVGETGAQHAGVQVGVVIEFFGGGVNALLGDGRDGGSTGELLRTMETVARERSRCLASILRVAGLSAPGRFLFAVIVLRGNGCATYGNSCTPLAGTAHRGEIGHESLLKTSFFENYKKLTTFRARPIKLFLLPFSDGTRLKGIFFEL
jgi:hypothetical protein